MKASKGDSAREKRGGVRSYARHRGCSQTAVEGALKSGRITRDSLGQIDFEKADQAWEANSRVRAPHSTQPPRTAPSSGPVIPGEEEALAGSAQYVKARAVREFYQASLARVAYEERVGRLLPRDEVETAAFNRYRQFREAMLNIPVRIAAIFSAESGLSSQRTHEILDAEIRRALNDFSERPNAQV